MRQSHGNLPRVHVPEALAAGAALALPAAAAHHLARVLRAAVGDELIVFNDGAEFAATVLRIERASVIVKLGRGAAVNRETPLSCRLAQAVASGERMDITLQKAVELGVRAVQPLFSERSVVRLDAARAARRVEHWRQVLISACEQCGRNVIPDLAAPQSLREWLSALGASEAGELRLLLSPHATQRLAEAPRPATVILLAGPEGGFTEIEAKLAQRHGFVAVRLGPRVLRTETAALAALAAIQALWGDF